MHTCVTAAQKTTPIAKSVPHLTSSMLSFASRMLHVRLRRCTTASDSFRIFISYTLHACTLPLGPCAGFTAPTTEPGLHVYEVQVLWHRMTANCSIHACCKRANCRVHSTAISNGKVGERTKSNFLCCFSSGCTHCSSSMSENAASEGCQRGTASVTCLQGACLSRCQAVASGSHAPAHRGGRPHPVVWQHS